jgi:hypothetical protein
LCGLTQSQNFASVILNTTLVRGDTGGGGDCSISNIKIVDNGGASTFSATGTEFFAVSFSNVEIQGATANAVTIDNPNANLLFEDCIISCFSLFFSAIILTYFSFISSRHTLRSLTGFSLHSSSSSPLFSFIFSISSFILEAIFNFCTFYNNF